MRIYVCGECGGVVGSDPSCHHFAKHHGSWREVEVVEVPEGTKPVFMTPEGIAAISGLAGDHPVLVWAEEHAGPEGLRLPTDVEQAAFDALDAALKEPST